MVDGQKRSCRRTDRSHQSGSGAATILYCEAWQTVGVPFPRPVGAERRQRAVSPVIGSILLVAIAVVLAALTFFIAGELADDTQPAPQASLDLQESEGSLGSELVLRGGEELGEGEGRVVVEGVADADVLQDETLTLDDPVAIHPVEEEVTVYWHSPGSDESYELASFDADPVPSRLRPDVGCSWVQNQTAGGTGPVTVDVVVDCDVATAGDVDVVAGGAVLGDVEGTQLDATDATITGDVDSGGDADLTNTTVVGDLNASTQVTGDTGSVVEGSVAGSSVDFTASDISGDIDSGSYVDLSDTTVGGTVEADGDVTIDTGTSVDRAVVTTGDVAVTSSSVGGDVYVDGSFSCSSSTIAGAGCGPYSPEDEDDYSLVPVDGPAASVVRG